MATIGKLPINEIGNTLFNIPYYQRGYRWTGDEAKKLLEDLYEFSRSKDDSYCLQPIVLQEMDANQEFKNVYRVVDGQQRLTTIAIMLIIINGEKDWDIYYEDVKKRLSELLDNSQVDSSPTINDHFRNEVRKTISEYDNDKLHSIMELFSQDSCKSVFFLKYIIPTSVDDSNLGEDEFLRLNDGKTPLTASELIRAKYMVSTSGLSEHERSEISKEWELIENTLRQDKFWVMFNSAGLEHTPTRIDLLFAIVLNVKLENASIYPRLIFETLENPNKTYDLGKVWKDLLNCFWWMQSCYADIELFHYLCWIRLFTDYQISTIYNDWKKDTRPQAFKNNIKSIIRHELEKIEFEKVDYSYNKDILRSFFVFLNSLDCINLHERFRFDFYKNESWDIEHIDSRTPNALAKDNERKSWLYYSYLEMNDIQKEEVSEALKNVGLDEPFLKKRKDEIEEGKEGKVEPYDSIIIEDYEKRTEIVLKVINRDLSDSEKIQNENGLGNLALLNMHINRSYKNAIFPAKRRILKAFVSDGSCYVPPCTSRAFMKFYTDTASKNLFWLKKDYDCYYSAMKGLFDKFMNEDIAYLQGQIIPMSSDSLQYECSRIQCETDDTDKTNNTTFKSKSPLVDNNEEVTFFSFMDRYNVVVPKIQRMYVQGRNDTHGHKCLTAFAQKLVNCVVGKDSAQLDFIYGIKDGTVFKPLDGQQRLTTLFLLSWICGINKPQWSFQYESRRTTEFFIKGLLSCTPEMLGLDYSDPKVKCSNAIRNSGWFREVWAEDEGITGMLNMLDSLYSKIIISGCKSFDFNSISFLVNYLDAASESYDQIYLKMNSRGKELTEWENIKTVLVKHAGEAIGAKAPKWIDKMNNVWYESMWNAYGSNPKIEDVDKKMRFIVQLAIECLDKNIGKNVEAYELDGWLTSHNTESRLFYGLAGRFFSGLEDEFDKELCPAWASKYRIDYKSDSIDGLYKPLLAQFAYSIKKDSDWMRFVWNMIENTVSNKAQFIQLFTRLCNIVVMPEYRQGIYQVLKTGKLNNPSEQLKEEIEKAEKILDKNEGERWKEIIIKMENYAFFHGAIRFLYRGEDSQPDWSDNNSKVKYLTAKRYFESYEEPIAKDYNSQGKLIRLLLTQISDSQGLRDIYFDHNREHWKTYILLNDNKSLIKAVHNLLTMKNEDEPRFDEFVSPLSGEMAVVHEQLVKTLSDLTTGLELIDDYRLGIRGTGNRRQSDHIYGYRLELLDEFENDWKNIRFKYNDSSFLWAWDNMIYKISVSDNRIEYVKRIDENGVEVNCCFHSSAIKGTTSAERKESLHDQLKILLC